MLKKIFLMIAVISLIWCISACSDDNDADIFNFKLDWLTEGLSSIDTYEGVLTRGSRGGISESVEFIIPEDKMQEFYEAFLEYEIYDLPEDISGKEPSYRPITYYTFKYTYNKETKTIKCIGADTADKDLFKFNTDTIPPTLEIIKDTPQARFTVFALMIREYILLLN